MPKVDRGGSELLGSRAVSLSVWCGGPAGQGRCGPLSVWRGPGQGRYVAIEMVRRARSTGSAALFMCYFCVAATFLAGAGVSRAVARKTSSANFRWVAISCSAKS